MTKRRVGWAISSWLLLSAWLVQGCGAAVEAPSPQQAGTSNATPDSAGTAGGDANSSSGANAGGTSSTNAVAGTGGTSSTSAAAGTGGTSGTSAAAGTGGTSGTNAVAGTGGTSGTNAAAGTGGTAPYPLIQGDTACPDTAPTITQTTCPSLATFCVYRGLQAASSTKEPMLCRCDTDGWRCVSSDENGETQCPLQWPSPAGNPEESCPASPCNYWSSQHAIALLSCYCHPEVDAWGCGA